MNCLWYRIVPLPAPGMTAADSFYSEPATFKHTVFFKRLQCIMRTGRRKPAFGPQYGRNDPLVYFYQCYKWNTKYLKQGFHLLWLSAFVK